MRLKIQLIVLVADINWIKFIRWTKILLEKARAPILLIPRGPLHVGSISRSPTFPSSDDADDEDVEDEVLVRRGVDFFINNVFSFFVCMLSGLVGLMFLPGAVQVLSLTNKSDNPLRVSHKPKPNRKWAHLNSVRVFSATIFIIALTPSYST